jgi:hypothetical protein
VVAAHTALGHSGPEVYASLHWIGLAWMVVAIALSVWAQRKMAKNGGRV